MENYDIKPLQGIGTIVFGMSPVEVRALLADEFQSFKRSPTAAFPCDYFPSLGVFGYYTAEGKLEALELASPAQPVLDGQNLLGVGFSTAKGFLKSKDAKLEEDVDMVIAHAIGVSLYAPLAKESPNVPCESVLVFAAGYYG